MSEPSQAEADALLSLQKRRCDEGMYRMPPQRGRLKIPLEDFDGREAFMLDIWRGGISLEKRTYQTRARQTVILARLDFGTPHRNPDGEEIGVPHLHVYREGFADKWAHLLLPDRFPNPGDKWATMQDFMRFCTIAEPPDIQRDFET